MSAPRSKAAAMAKRYGKMADGYQQRIANQLGTIERMLKALTLCQEALYQIEHEAKNVKEARTMAHNAGIMLNVALQKEPDDAEKNPT